MFCVEEKLVCERFESDFVKEMNGEGKQRKIHIRR